MGMSSSNVILISLFLMFCDCCLRSDRLSFLFAGFALFWGHDEWSNWKPDFFCCPWFFSEKPFWKPNWGLGCSVAGLGYGFSCAAYVLFSLFCGAAAGLGWENEN